MLTATLRKNWALLAFGWLMTFGSAFGQTYFISIFGGLIRDEFALSHASFGTLYSTGTLLSAFVLMWAGRLIDRLPLLTFSSFAIAGLTLSTVVMRSASGWLTLILAFFCLRFFGQGLMTHAAMTAMARHFTAERGRAVSFAALGHVCAEAVLPILAVTLMAALYWRTIWLACAACLLTLFLPLIVVLLRQQSDEPRQHAATSAPSAGNRSPREGASLSTVLKDPLLYCLLPALMAPAFISTGLIFHQIHIGAEKGWALEVLAFGLTAFAAGSFVMMLTTGVLVDRLTTRRLMPFSLLPTILACAVLAATDSRWGALVFFSLLGVQSGLMSVIHVAVWAEVYGVIHLGAIRAFATSTMVFASGLAPAIVGVLIGWEWTIAGIVLLLAAYSVIASGAALFGVSCVHNHARNPAP
jgi:MFS family permease